MLVDQKMTSKRDTLVMPILYNARHGLELGLKYAVSELATMELVHRPDGRANHHSEVLQASLGRRCGGQSSEEIVAALEPFAVSLSRMDADGQQLRYFSTADDRRSLGKQSVVHLPLIRESVTRLSTILGELTERLSDMRAQHGDRHSNDALLPAGLGGNRQDVGASSFLVRGRLSGPQGEGDGKVRLDQEGVLQCHRRHSEFTRARCST